MNGFRECVSAFPEAFFDFEGRERKWVPSGGGAEMGCLAPPPDGTHFLSLVTGKGRRLQAAPGDRIIV